MENVSQNIQRLYHKHSIFEKDVIHSDNDTNHNKIFPDVSYTEGLTSAFLPMLSIEHYISTESYYSAERESERNYTLAKMLEESWWNVFDEKFVRHSWEWTLTLIIAYMTILIAGVIGNSMVILVVLQKPQMRTVTNIFIMNLAVADLFVIVFCVGPTLLANVLQPWILGSFMCKAVAYVQGVSVCAAVNSLVAISLDRCYAVYKPMDRYRGVSKSQAFKSISLIWIIALIATLPRAVISEIVISDEDGLPYCNEVWMNEFFEKMYFLFTHLILCYILPLILISVSNGIVWCHVTNRNVPHESASAAIIVKRVHRRARENARKMLGIVTLTFLISWLPLYIIVTRVKFARDMSESEQHWIHLIMPFAQWMGSCNSCINPILYAFLNRKFREEFHSLLPSWVRFFHRNKMMGIGMGGYGVNVSVRNCSSSYRKSLFVSCRNSARNYSEGNYNRKSMFVSKFSNNTVTSSLTLVTTNIVSRKFEGKCYLVKPNIRKDGLVKSTLGSITDL